MKIIFIIFALWKNASAFEVMITDFENVDEPNLTDKTSADQRDPKSLWCLLYSEKCRARCVGQKCEDFCVLTSPFFSCLYTCGSVSVGCVSSNSTVMPVTTTTATSTITPDINSLLCQDYICRVRGPEQISEDTTINTFTSCQDTCTTTPLCQYVTFTIFRNQPVCHLLSSCTLEEPYTNTGLCQSGPKQCK